MEKQVKIDLRGMKCTPCRGGAEPLAEPKLSEYLQNLSGGWRIVENRQLEKDFRFKNFKEALDFTNNVGHLAEQQGHHPDIALSWGKVKVQIWTHKIGGLHENELIGFSIDD